MSSRSGVANLRTAIHLLLTYLLVGPSVSCAIVRRISDTDSVSGPTVPRFTRHRPSPRSDHVTSAPEVAGLRRSSDIGAGLSTASTFPAAPSIKGSLPQR